MYAFRPVVALAATSLLLVAAAPVSSTAPAAPAPVVAAAGPVSSYAVTADTSAVSLSVFEEAVGDTALVLGATDAFGSSDPLASAAVNPIEILGTAVLGDQFAATSDRDRVRNPAEGDGCLLSPEVDGLTVGAVCAVAIARGGPAGVTENQDASSVLTVAGVDVDGRFVADLLTQPIGELLEALLDGAGAAVVADAIDELAAQCDAVIGEIADALDPLDAVPAAAGDLIALTGAELDAATEVLDLIVDPSCSALLQLVASDIVQDLVDVTPIADALADVDLLDISVGDQRSAIAGTETSVGAASEQVFVTITSPSLDLLDDVINGAVSAVLDGVVEEIEIITGQDLADALGIDETVAGILDMVPLLDDPTPFLTVAASGGTAEADLELADGTASGAGDLPYVSLAFAPSLFELFGQDPDAATVTLTAGQTETVAEGTPLETTISVGDVQVFDAVELDDTRLFGTRTDTSATTLTLLGGEGAMGGVVLSLGASSAGAYGASIAEAPSPSPAPAPAQPQLPNTGGGAIVAAILALGAGLALRRRRD